MPILLDASLYIRALRGGEGGLLLQRWARESPLWLSAVVLEELYAGAGPNEQRFLEKLERDFDKARRVLVPISATGRRLGDCLDMWDAGMVLNALARRG
jgi:predicted nucleic acid-binding protein